MTCKKPLFLFLVFFISCSTSIRDQISQQTAVARLSVEKAVPAPAMLAQTKVANKATGLDATGRPR
jgi:hypothetical protein